MSTPRGLIAIFNNKLIISEAKGVLVRVIIQETLSDEGYGNLTAMDDETFTQTVDVYSNEVISTCGYEDK